MRLATVFVICAVWASGQPVFDAASVKVSTAIDYKERQAPVAFTPGRLTMRGVTLKTAIVTAYGVKDYQVSGGGIESDRYDILATAASGAGDDQLKLMLQGLLAERFKLAFHREPKEVSVYALVAGKKDSKLVESKADGPPTVRLQGGDMVFQAYTLGKLSDYLSRMRSVDRPVLDMTGIPGVFDLTVHFWDAGPNGGIVEAKRAAEQAFSDPDMPMKIATQLGLRLESRKAPVEMIVVDHADRPTEN
jgi:uncharacterized protein (TIGR03435 family)